MTVAASFVVPGATVDFVRALTSAGVGYRRSPHFDDRVRGGVRENSQIKIYCYTTGDVVNQNRYWAKVVINPDRYVPAAYLRYGHLGRPRGVKTC